MTLMLNEDQLQQLARVAGLPRTGLETRLAALYEAGIAVVPTTPTPGLLRSMAFRRDHALGLNQMKPWVKPNPPNLFEYETDAERDQRIEQALRNERQVHEEVVGTGFYSAEREHLYVYTEGKI